MTAVSAALDVGSKTITRHPYRLLGSFRFLLAISVLLGHTSSLVSEVIHRHSIANLGVMLFFVVSGFVIAEALDIFYRNQTVRFLINRAFKIYPAYWFAVALTYLLHSQVTIPLDEAPPLQYSAWGIFVNIALLPSMLKEGNNLLVISVAWGILVECQFYFVAAGLVAVANKFHRRTEILVVAGWLVLLGYVYVYATGSHSRFFGYLQFSPFFVFGSCIYLTMTRRNSMFLVLMLISVLLSFHAFFEYNLYGARRTGAWDWSAGLPWHVINLTVLYGLGLALMMWLLRSEVDRRLEWWDKRLGDLTYAIYVVHQPVIPMILLLGLWDPATAVLCWLATIVTAIAAQRWAERPLSRIRDRLRGRALYA